MSLKIPSSFGVNFVLSGLPANSDYRWCSFPHLSDCLCIEAATSVGWAWILWVISPHRSISVGSRTTETGTGWAVHPTHERNVFCSNWYMTESKTYERLQISIRAGNEDPFWLVNASCQPFSLSARYTAFLTFFFALDHSYLPTSLVLTHGAWASTKSTVMALISLA